MGQRTARQRHWCLSAAVLILLMFSSSAFASPWTSAEDAQLRSDIEILANAGVIDGIVTQWPLPWHGLLQRLKANSALANQPGYVRAAASRVLARGQAETSQNELQASVAMDATNDPSFVRGFDATGREKLQATFSIEKMLSPSTTLHLNIGVQSSSTFKPLPEPNIVPAFDPTTGYSLDYFLDDRPDHQTLMFDGSYLAQKIGGGILYAGYLPHWWGPGWISALMESTNARPFPQVGIVRNSTTAFSWPILKWLGPWQAEFLVGVLDGPGVTQNILTDSLRVAFNPINGLELGFSRTQLLCGTDHPCKPLLTFFQVQHNDKNPDNGNSAGQYDIRYTNRITGIPFSFYTQFMFMDAGSPTPIGVSSLVGTSWWVPIDENTLRLTAEFTSSEPTYNPFTFDDIEHGFAYNSPKYLGGYRYRGDSLGFSLDSDSDLFTLQASYASANRVITVTFDRANVSNNCNVPGCAFPGEYGNVVTTAPVTIDMLDTKYSFPFHDMTISISGRLQDDQPRPQRGFTGGIEIALKRSLG